jgi:hypothetical protein
MDGLLNGFFRQIFTAQPVFYVDFSIGPWRIRVLFPAKEPQLQALNQRA